MRRAPLLALVLVAFAAPAAAQNSAYGMLGVGFPTRPVSMRTRALGDGGASVDEQSGLNPATLGLVNRITVAVGAEQEYRTLTLRGVETPGLRQARFPYIMMTGRFGRTRLSYSAGFFQYAERTFDLSSTDTVMLRGAPVIETQRNGSTGGLADVRAALAWSFSKKVAVGLGWHALSGSARLTARRTFSDSIYRAYTENSDARFSGFGLSGGILATPSAAFSLGLSARVDSKLKRAVGTFQGNNIGLPATLSAGFQARLAKPLRFAANTTWRSWSAAQDGVDPGTKAFNTIEAGAGFEWGGGTGRGSSRLPLRLGVRYATLPFSPTADQPHELDLTGGTRWRFAENRALVDFTVERAMRDGGAVSERAWQFSIGFELIP